MNLKEISFDSIIKEWNIIKIMSLEELNAITDKSKLGCNIIDYYFFEERLKTKGNKGINFYEFLQDIEIYKTKRYIQTLLSYCDKNNRYNDNIYKRYYYIYGLSFGRVNAFKITNALKIYKTYNPTHILDPFCGFGGRLVAAKMLNMQYTGIDINHDLQPCYNKLLYDFSFNKQCNTLYFQDCLTVDYSKINYDMVFTSPPYENIEVYPNNPIMTIKEWSVFYNKIFKLLWDNLKKGYYIININAKIYNKILVPLLGECLYKHILTKAKRNNYVEYIYVWHKIM
jgi:DNA modification methylase